MSNDEDIKSARLFCQQAGIDYCSDGAVDAFIGGLRKGRFESRLVATKFALSKFCEDYYSLEPWIIGHPEGSRAEWLDVIAKIEKKKSCRYKRVEAIPLRNGNIRWSSPRNSNGSAVEMPKDQLASFIAQAKRVLTD